MATKTTKDAEELQQQITDQFQQFLQARSVSGVTSSPPAAADLPALIKEAQANLDAATRRRDEILRQAELQIERRQQQLVALQNELSRSQGNATVAQASTDKVKAKRK